MMRVVLTLVAVLTLSACSKPSDSWRDIARGSGQVVNQL